MSYTGKDVERDKLEYQEWSRKRDRQQFIEHMEWIRKNIQRIRREEASYESEYRIVHA